MSNLDEQLSALLSKSPDSLLKALKKLCKENGTTPEHVPANKRSSVQHSPYINITTVLCSLCNSEAKTEVVMEWSDRLKGYVIGHSLLPGNERPKHPLHTVELVTESCDKCPSVLENYEKSELIALLMNKAKRDERYFTSLHAIAKRVVTLD